VPEWQRLYDSMEAAQVPLDSAEWNTRKSLLTYYGDTLKLLELTANMLEAKQVDDKASKMLVQVLVQKVDRERGEVLKRGATSLTAPRR
jgi:hypothetical protein